MTKDRSDKIFHENKRLQYLGLFYVVVCFLSLRALTAFLYISSSENPEPIKYHIIISYIIFHIILLLSVYHSINHTSTSLRNISKFKKLFFVLPAFSELVIFFLSIKVIKMVRKMFIYENTIFNLAVIINILPDLLISVYIIWWIWKDNKNHGVNWFWAKKKYSFK